MSYGVSATGSSAVASRCEMPGWFRDRSDAGRSSWSGGTMTIAGSASCLPRPMTRSRSGRRAKITLNHYPMLTWNGQHHGSVESPNIHLYGHIHALYDRDPPRVPSGMLRRWAALDVGFDGHDYQVWSLAEVMDRLRPRLEAFEEMKRRSAALRPFPGPRAACRRRPGVARIRWVRDRSRGSVPSSRIRAHPARLPAS